MRAVARLALLLGAGSLCAGCGGNNPWQSRQPLFGGQPGSAPAAASAASATPAAPPPEVDPAQLADLGRQASALEESNREMHRKLAEAEQQAQLLRDQVALLRGQLNETASNLRDSEAARDQADQRFQALLASSKTHGAKITANNSVKQSLQLVSLPGLEVRQDGDLVRIEIPADRLFRPGTVEWVEGAGALLDQAAAAISSSYSRQMIAIEGHFDSSAISLPGGSQQLTASQALAVYQHLTTRNSLPPKQLFTMALGGNRPRVSNATEAGRAKNRRIELVIYPEQMP